MVRLNVNGSLREIDADPGAPLLWALREQLGLTGTKYGCGVAQLVVLPGLWSAQDATFRAC
jgi:isoquinoline 1-oxidoreductase alpha subunit